MFTGIIEEKGIISSVSRGRVSASLHIIADKVLEGLKTGDSINTNGVCLTVTSFDAVSFSVDVIAETMRLTNLKDLANGDAVNLERALKLSDRLGGHMVSGHIDGTGRIKATTQEENATWITITTTEAITRYIVAKGSVAIDGISLTVVTVSEREFQVSIIPHTGSETTLLDKKTGDTLNIECDISAKYIEKFLLHDKNMQKGSIDFNYLTEHGFID